MPGDELIVDLDRFPILLQPDLAVPLPNLVGQGFFKSRGRIDTQLVGFLQEVAVDAERLGLLLCRLGGDDWQ